MLELQVYMGAKSCKLVTHVHSRGHVLTKELATFLTQAKETACVQVLAHVMACSS